jgi:hypothetical protein
MGSMTFALGVACVLGLAFDSTRPLGVACAALLGLRFPVPFFLFLLAAGTLFYLHRR